MLKPSDTTPASTLLMAEIMAEILPAGRLQRGRAATATPAGRWSSTRSRRWCRSPARCGPAWRSPAAPRDDLKRVHLELGGKAPVVVFDDADLAQAAEDIAVAGYFNAGQDCTAATRVLAAPGHPRRLRRRARRAGRGPARRPGGPTTRTCCTAPLNNANQLDPGRGLPRAAPGPRQGRRRRPPGRRPGYFYAPTVVSGLQQDDEMIQDEIFGPVITVQRFSDEDEAVRWANGVELRPGLVASGPATTAGRCGWPSALDFGCVWINTHIPLVAEMPHGGFKHSGLRQGPVDVRVRGLHPHQARHVQHRRLTLRPSPPSEMITVP